MRTAPVVLEGVFLDMYGTLADGDRAAVEAVCQRIVADHALPLSAPELAIAWGNRFFAAIETANGPAFKSLFELEQITLTATLAERGLQVDPVPYARALKQYWARPPLHAEVLESLARLSVPVCIVSNADHDDVAAALHAHGLGHLPFVTSECAASYKPDAAVFQMALRRTGWDPSRIIHVGDSLHSDVGGAAPLGIRTGWVCREDRIHDVGEARPDHVFRDLREMADWVCGHAPPQALSA